MTEDEALELLIPGVKSKKLSLEDERKSKDLVKMLGYLPLAIDQVRGFLTEAGYATSIDKYVDVFEKHKEKVIKPVGVVPNAMVQRSNLYTTFELSLAPFVEAGNEPALRILMLGAFFGLAPIDEAIFLEYRKVQPAEARPAMPAQDPWDQIRFRRTVLSLAEQSLVKLHSQQDRFAYSLHPMIREWLRLRVDTNPRSVITWRPWT
ncbi:hypothetical protein BDV95DRAFT_251958 [Massariosphaeria phaeospora]|uniref:Uncharacterized protein n=1 Tax=Massariosphaeria phaeospora TaxID=100035 RepID=A0A7C8M1X2_9PLEO|nr:hypothetical protein BDV95DRAFT_251958 [Massariosphaeria phaeospora]